MLSGATCNACAIVGTAVLRMVVSSDSMKNATAISHGSTRLLAAVGGRGDLESDGKAAVFRRRRAARMAWRSLAVNAAARSD